MEIPEEIKQTLQENKLTYTGYQDKSKVSGYTGMKIYAVRNKENEDFAKGLNWIYYDKSLKQWAVDPIRDATYQKNAKEAESLFALMEGGTKKKRKKKRPNPAARRRSPAKAGKPKPAIKMVPRGIKRAKPKPAPRKKARSPSPTLDPSVLRSESVSPERTKPAPKAKPKPKPASSVIGGIFGSLGSMFGSAPAAAAPKPAPAPSGPMSVSGSPAKASAPPDLSASIAKAPSPVKKPPKKVAFVEPHVAPVFEAELGEQSLEALQQISQAAMEQHVAAVAVKKQVRRYRPKGSTSVWRRPPRRTPAYTTQRPYQMNLRQQSFRELLGWMPKYEALYS